MKLLKLKILFSLANDVDLFSTEEQFLYFSYPKLYWRLQNYVPSSIRDAVNQLTKSGHVMKIIRNQRTFFRLTEVGREELLAHFSFSRHSRWDKTWRLIIIKSEKTTSNQVRWLRHQLRLLGCRNLERSVYITPLNLSKDIKQLLFKHQLLGAVTVLETKKFVVGDDKAFATATWRLDEIVISYLEFINQTNQLIKVVRSSKVLTNRLKKAFISAFNRWFLLLQKNPGLPSQLLPKDWNFEEAKQAYIKLANSVWELEEESINRDNQI